LDQTFFDLFLNLFLGLSVVGVSVHELGHSLLLFFLLLKLSLELLTHNLLDEPVVIGLKSRSKFWVISLEKGPLMGVALPDLLQLLHLSFHCLILLIMEN